MPLVSLRISIYAQGVWQTHRVPCPRVACAETVLKPFTPWAGQEIVRIPSLVVIIIVIVIVIVVVIIMVITIVIMIVMGSGAPVQSGRAQRHGLHAFRGHARRGLSACELRFMRVSPGRCSLSCA